jgi:membrane protein required for beta-lactamase induction
MLLFALSGRGGKHVHEQKGEVVKAFMRIVRRWSWLILALSVALLPAIAAGGILLVRANQSIAYGVLVVLVVIMVVLVVVMIRKSRNLTGSLPPRPRKTLETLTLSADDTKLAA